MKIYKVGGAVRDSIMGVQSSDNDWVVVGSSPEEMISKGYKPIGKDFPVFLHPRTNEEYALARTEKKTLGKLSLKNLTFKQVIVEFWMNFEKPVLELFFVDGFVSLSEFFQLLEDFLFYFSGIFQWRHGNSQNS